MGSQQNLHQSAKLNGVFKASLNGEISWTGRFIVIGNGVHIDSNSAGHWDISPPTGTVAVVGGGTRTVNAAANGNTGGVLLNAWETLWYRLPLEAGNATVNTNFIIAPYTSVFDADEHWIQVAQREDDNSIRLADGSTLVLGEQSGTKDVSNARDITNPINQWYGIQFVAPGFAAVVAGAVAYGFNSPLRSLGFGANNEGFNSGYFDVPTPTVGLAVYDQTGAPIARTWRAPVANDRMNQLGDLSRSGYPINYATQPLVDILQNETLWFNANPQSTNVGTWHITSYAASPQNPSNWIKVATFQSLEYNGLNVFGGRSIQPGDFVAYNDTRSAESSENLTKFSSFSRGLPMVAWTPSNHFAGTGANGVLSSSYGLFVKWSTPISYFGISNGFSSTSGGGGAGSGLQYLNGIMPSAGLQIPVLGTAITRTVDPIMGIPLAAWEALYYVPPAYAGGTNTVDAGWVVASYAAPASIPHNAIKVAQFIAERTIPNAVQSAIPFSGANGSGQDYRGGSLWFLGDYATGGVGPGAIGNLGTIGTTESYRAVLFGAANAGATGLGTGAISYPGWSAGYRIECDRYSRKLATTGLIQFPVTGTLVAGNIVGFMPGVQLDKNLLVPGLLQPNNGADPNAVLIDIRLVTATVAGVAGSQIVVSGIAKVGNAIAIGAGGWLDLRCFDGKTLD
jgi:hypothetical protein